MKLDHVTSSLQYTIIMKRFESAFMRTHGTELFYQTWQVNKPLGTIVILHGFAEHSECYHAFAQRMNRSSWDVIAWDMQGHGRSEGKRGYIENFEHYCQDLLLWTNHLIKAEKLDQKGPRILFAHSMGGLIGLRTIIEYEDMGYKALCLSSPLLGLAIKVPKIKEKFAHFIVRLLPKITLYNEINYEDLSLDREMVKSYSKDPLRHEKISPQVFFGIIESIEEIKKMVDKIQLPVLMQLAGQDRIANSADAERIFHQLSIKKKILHVYPESYHEIFNDLDKELAFQHLNDFIKDFISEPI